MMEAPKSTNRNTKKATAIVPPIPAPPSTWNNIPADISYVSALIIFILGVLASTGVLLPESVSSNIDVITGGIAQVAAVLVVLINNIMHKSVQKAIIRSGQNPPLGKKLY